MQNPLYSQVSDLDNRLDRVEATLAELNATLKMIRTIGFALGLVISPSTISSLIGFATRGVIPETPPPVRQERYYQPPARVPENLPPQYQR
jgi:hypothetical protein